MVERALDGARNRAVIAWCCQDDSIGAPQRINARQRHQACARSRLGTLTEPVLPRPKKDTSRQHPEAEIGESGVDPCEHRRLTELREN